MTEVEKILTDKKIRFLPKGKDLLVACFNPDHEDSNPSMRIDREDGRYHCFSCGYRGDLLADLGRHRNIFSDKVNKLLEKIRELKYAAGISLPEDAFPYTSSFRDITTETIIKFEAFTSEKEFPERIVFPIKDAKGTITGLLGRYRNSNAKPKYMIRPKHVSLPLFPEPNRIELLNNSIVLVEGLFDMLNLHDKGIRNALCCFGTTQLNKDNIKDSLLPYRIQGAEKVYILFDGDTAGRKASKNLETIIKYNTELLVEVLELGDGVDPGDLSQADVDSLKNHLLNNTGD